MQDTPSGHFRAEGSMRHRIFAGLATIAVGLGVLSAQATAQNIQNGSFSNVQTGQTSSYLLTPGTTSVPGWTYGAGVGTAFGCMVISDSISPACNSNLGAVTAGENPGLSPNGGNFLAIDVDSTNNAFISQVLAGLHAGTKYNITFYQAAINSETVTSAAEWVVTLGGTQLNPTPVVMHPNTDSFSPWMQETISFTATAGEVASPTLEFLAQSTLSGGPPIALIDGISVPEPASIALFGVGIVGLAGLRRRRARQSA